MKSLAVIAFAAAIVHTFSVHQICHLSHKLKEGSKLRSFVHLLSEVEIVFGFWAILFLIGMFLTSGFQSVTHYLQKLDFTEPLFVFVIMTLCSTRPILQFAEKLLLFLGQCLPLPMPSEAKIYFSCMTFGPLLGSLITEPAAMTVTALLLKNRYYHNDRSNRFLYLTLGTLLVNVSIGGVLTPFAAPPVLMVAQTWDWDLIFMLKNFGWKAFLAIIFNGMIACRFLYDELKTPSPILKDEKQDKIPLPAYLFFLMLLIFMVCFNHSPLWLIGAFVLFLIQAFSFLKNATGKLSFRGSFLVAFFLSGLIVLGESQNVWIEPLIRDLTPLPLFLGTTFLTSFTDNAALTYLGSRVPEVSEGFKYALVAGAVAGGGLTVIANAPNPAAFAILEDHFKPEGISPLGLLIAALLPTLVALFSFWIL